jgi:hypothetical protein
MYFEHNFMNIDAVMLIPDSNQVEINREKNMTSENQIKLTVSFEVQTYYPAYRKPRFGQPSSDPMDKNKAWSNVYNYDSTNLSTTDILVYPKKTRWYSNLIESRGNGNPRSTNQNSDKDINKQ